MNSNVTSLHDFQLKKGYQTRVMPFFSRFQTSFHHYREENEAVIILNLEPYAFVFLSYVPKGEESSLLTLEESFEPTPRQKRVSTGEWLVEGMYEMKKDKAERLLDAMATYDPSNVFSFLKEVLKK